LVSCVLQGTDARLETHAAAAVIVMCVLPWTDAHDEIDNDEYDDNDDDDDDRRPDD